MDIDTDDLTSPLDVDDEDNVQLTPAELINMTEEIWINEKFAPELLPNKFEIVQCVLEQIAYMEQNLESLSSSDFKKGIHQLELDRIRYLVVSYLRNRLEKIEAYAFHILKQESQRADKGDELYLTEAEQQFAKNYTQGLGRHFDAVTSFYPGLPVEDWRNQVQLPNLHGFVFLKAKSRLEGVVIDAGREEDGDVVDLNPGSQMILSYNSVANLVKNNEVNLI